MRRRMLLASLVLFPWISLVAQGARDSVAWNDAATLRLVDRAVARRIAQLADTGLTDYTARAHGYVTFLAQVGEGFPDPPKVMKTDELAVDVLWRAPNQSKQRIVGRRDTLLLPTDIAYHRDHLAIVQNNFPSVIRLGDGDEVRDVPHPLSLAGREAYDFAIADSLTIRSNDRDWQVLMVRVRPKDDRQPRAVGAVYLDRGTASVVRMALSFTRAALRDTQLEDVSVVLENGLVDGRFWLPRRQEIEIRRTGSWMDFPSRGIIRGRWEICCVTPNVGLQAPRFVGPEYEVAPPWELRAFKFDGKILDRLPSDVTVATDDDVRAVQESAREMVRSAALARTRSTNAAARSVSDLVRVNRVEGLALGLGVRRTLGLGFSATARGRWGTANHQAAGELGLGWMRADGWTLGVRAFDELADAGDEPETSGARNSLAAQEFGSDYTAPYRARGVALRVARMPADAWQWSLSVERQDESAVVVHARPATGRFESTPAADSLTAWRLIGRIRRSSLTLGQGTLTFDATAQLEQADFLATGRATATFGRGSMLLDYQRPVTGGLLVLHTAAATVAGADVPAQRLVRLGGPVTGPGFEFHQFVGRSGWSQRVEIQHRVPFVPINLGRFGRVPSTLVLAPFVVGIGSDAPGTSHWHGAVGLGVLSLFDMLRVDVARGIGNGRWTFGVDVGRSLWPIL